MDHRSRASLCLARADEDADHDADRIQSAARRAIQGKVPTQVEIKWKKSPDGKALTAEAGQLLLELAQTGDGRWAWKVRKTSATNPMASGIAGSLGAAKTVTAQFAERTGLV